MHTLVRPHEQKVSYYKVQAAFNGPSSQFAELFHIPMTLVLRSLGKKHSPVCPDALGSESWCLRKWGESTVPVLCLGPGSSRIPR